MAKPTILAVDDDAAVVAAVVRDLRVRYGEDYRVLRATSGARRSSSWPTWCSRTARSPRSSRDQRMPGMSGIEVLRRGAASSRRTPSWCC